MTMLQRNSIQRRWLALLAAAGIIAAIFFFQSNVAFAAPEVEVDEIEIVASHDLLGIQEVVATIYFDEAIQFASGASAATLAAELDVDINITNITTDTNNPMAFEITSVGSNYFVLRVFETGNGMFAIRGANMSVKTLDASGELDSLVSTGITPEKAILLDTDFQDLIIDTGIEVTTLSSTTGTSVVNPIIEGQITAVPQVRGISWFQLLNNGVVQEYGYDPVEDEYTYTWPVPVLTGASPLHSHAYLTLEADDYVAALEAAINGDPNLSGDYELVIDGTDPTKFTIEKISGGDGETLSIRFFTYELQ